MSHHRRIVVDCDKYGRTAPGSREQQRQAEQMRQLGILARKHARRLEVERLRREIETMQLSGESVLSPHEREQIREQARHRALSSFNRLLG